MSFLPIALIFNVGLKAQTVAHPGTRTVPDAHNCYPYDGRWTNRIDRALASGMPVAIEQDLRWYVPNNGGHPRIVVSHDGKLTGNEPGLEEYFFDRIQPVVEAAVRNPDHSQWPLITLNLDFKTNEPELLEAVWKLLQKHQAWLTTAERTNDAKSPQPLHVGPILVLNGPSDAQQRVFYDDVPAGSQLLTFGAVHTNMGDPIASPVVIEAEPVSNYRRWWNNPWTVVEPRGQQQAGPWTAESEQRLQNLVAHAHEQGLWIRFYTLDGASNDELAANGWFKTYSFATLKAANVRWRAAIMAGADYVATDQYEQLAACIHETRLHRLIQ